MQLESVEITPLNLSFLRRSPCRSSFDTEAGKYLSFIDAPGFILKAGIVDGRISMERLEEAVTRILALKASLKLHENNIPIKSCSSII